MKLITLCVAVLYSSVCFSMPFAKVLKTKGDVTLSGKSINSGDLISVSGLLKTKAKSFVKISIPEWNSSLVLGPNGNLDLDLSEKSEKKYSFIKGRIRWITSKGKKSKGVLHTKQASVGVRGTDYLLIANSLLGESEIIIFDGQVNFQNSSNPSDSVLLSKNQWGGIGGRYGKSIGEILHLPENVINAFSKQLVW